MDKKQALVIGIMIVVSFFFLRHEAERTEALRKAQAEKAQTQQVDRVAGEAPVVSPTPIVPQQKAVPVIARDTIAPAIALPEESKVEQLPDIVVHTKNFKAVFSNKGAVLKSFTLNEPYLRKTKDETSPLTLLDQIDVKAPPSFAIDKINKVTGLATRNYQVLTEIPDNNELNSPAKLEFQAVINSWRITKTFSFDSGDDTKAGEGDEAVEEASKPLDYGIKMSIKIENLADAPRDLSWWLTALSGFIPDDLDSRLGMVNFIAGSKAEGDKIDITSKLVSSLKNETLIEDKAGQVVWMGIKGRFFASLLQIKTPDRAVAYAVQYLSLAAETEYVKNNPELLPFVEDQPNSAIAFWQMLDNRPIQPMASQDTDFYFYGGPIKASNLEFEPTFEGVVTYSWSLFDPISRLLSKFLAILYRIIPNYGICIILATLLIKTAMHGLTRKATAGQHKMQKLQPLIKEIKEKYKSDPAKQQQETMKLWRENGVSPWGSCLPMLIQIPVFIALYGTFARDFTIRQALFIPGWIEDLSQPDQLFPLGFNIPLMGWDQFNLLPILYVVMQLVQQSMTPKSTDPQQQSQQQMMKMMPLVFMFIFYTMPSGLVLYFTVSAGYTLVEHYIIRKQIDGKDDAVAEALPTAAGKGFASSDKDKSTSGKKRKR